MRGLECRAHFREGQSDPLKIGLGLELAGRLGGVGAVLENCLSLPPQVDLGLQFGLDLLE